MELITNFYSFLHKILHSFFSGFLAKESKQVMSQFFLISCAAGILSLSLHLKWSLFQLLVRSLEPETASPASSNLLPFLWVICLPFSRDKPMRQNFHFAFQKIRKIFSGSLGLLAWCHPFFDLCILHMTGSASARSWMLIPVFSF